MTYTEIQASAAGGLHIYRDSLSVFPGPKATIALRGLDCPIKVRLVDAPEDEKS